MEQPLKTLVILTTAFNPSSTHHTAFGDTRLRQYVLGLSRVAEVLKQRPEFDAIIVDNTITDGWQMPAELQKVVQAMPRTKTVFFSDNALPSINKGCGNVIAWRRAQQATNDFADYNYVIHFEPRCLLLDFSFFEQFERRPAGYILFEKIRPTSSNQCKRMLMKLLPVYHTQTWTGIFSITTTNFRQMLKSIDVQQMADKKISLENVVYDYRQFFRPVRKLGLLWHDALNNRYIFY